MAKPTAPSNVVALGRAYVRLIEAARVIIGYTEDDLERDDLKALMKDYQAALRELLSKVSPEMSAQILAASDKLLGTVQDVGKN